MHNEGSAAQEHDSPLRWELNQAGSGKQLVLEGEINESTCLEQVAGQVDGGPLAIDTYNVRRINSLGVREWVNFIRTLQTIPDVRLVRCSPAIVAQLNSVYNFKGHAKIESVAAPFFCSKCDTEHLEVVELSSAAQPATLLAQPRTCPACGGQMEFDDLPDRYFLFVIE